MLETVKVVVSQVFYDDRSCPASTVRERRRYAMEDVRGSHVLQKLLLSHAVSVVLWVVSLRRSLQDW